MCGSVDTSISDEYCQREPSISAAASKWGNPFRDRRRLAMPRDGDCPPRRMAARSCTIFCSQLDELTRQGSCALLRAVALAMATMCSPCQCHARRTCRFLLARPAQGRCGRPFSCARRNAGPPRHKPGADETVSSVAPSYRAGRDGSMRRGASDFAERKERASARKLCEGRSTKSVPPRPAARRLRRH